RGNDPGFLAQHLAEAVQDAIDEAHGSIEETGLHASHRIAPDDALRLANLDARQLCRVFEERFSGDSQTRCDGASQIRALFGNHVEGYCRAKVNHDDGATVLLE